MLVQHMLNCKAEYSILLNFCDRLKNERLGLRLSQLEFAQKAGVSKTTQFNYEKGDRHPDVAYLSTIAAIGVDVNYLITGSRLLNDGLSSDEEKLLLNYRHATDEQKRSIYQISEAFMMTGTKSKPSHWHRISTHQPLVYFGGFTPADLAYLEALAEREGLKVSVAGRVTRLTDWAVLSDTASQSDRSAATEQGVPILTRDEFCDLARSSDDE